MDRGRCPRLAGGLAGAPKAADPHTQTTGPASPPPHFLLPAAPSHPPGPLASSDAPEPWRGSRAGVGVKKGRRSLAVRLGGRKRSPAPASLLPASRANLSSRRFHPGPREAQCPQKRRKGAGSARPRVLWTPHFGGSCSQSYLPPLDTPPPQAPPERSWQCLHGSAYPPARLAVFLAAGQVCEAGPAHRAGEPARPTCERAIRIDAAQPLAAPTPYQRRRGGLPGAGSPAPLAYFTS